MKACWDNLNRLRVTKTGSLADDGRSYNTSYRIHECFHCHEEYLASEPESKYCSKECASNSRIKTKSKDYSRKYNKAYREKHPLLSKTRSLFYGARDRARKKKVAFRLTESWVRRHLKRGCELTGIPFVFGKGKGGPFSPSIDRIDPAWGYTERNCRIVLLAVNMLKGSGTDDDMFFIAQKLVEVKANRDAEAAVKG